MRPDGGHAWMCDAGDLFEDDAGMAARLAARIEGGDDQIMFSREGSMFRLTSEDSRSGMTCGRTTTAAAAPSP